MKRATFTSANGKPSNFVGEGRTVNSAIRKARQAAAEPLYYYTLLIEEKINGQWKERTVFKALPAAYEETSNGLD